MVVLVLGYALTKSVLESREWPERGNVLPIQNLRQPSD